MTDDSANRPDATPPETPPETPADSVAHPEQPPMDDDVAAVEVEDEAAKLGDFA